MYVVCKHLLINLCSLFKVFCYYFPLLSLMATPILNADCLELALQFGMIMMFACAFPLAFAFAALVNSLSISLYLGCFTKTVHFLCT